MPYKSAAQLMTAARKLYDQQKYLEAADILENHWRSFEDDKELLIHWNMCVNALGGRQKTAIEYFTLLIDEGMWFPPGFVDDSDFDSLRDVDEFQRLKEISLERYAVAQADAKPELFVHATSDEPLPAIIVCHGNGGNVELTDPHWVAAVEDGWLVALPQSSQVAGEDIFVWTDFEVATAELKAHFQHLRKRGVQEDRVIVAGFSMGGHLALHIAVNNIFPVQGVILVASALPYEIESYDLSTLSPDVAFYIIVGELETSLVPRTHQLAERVQQRGNRVCVDQRPDLSHEYPEDFADTLRKAVAFIEEQVPV